MDQQSPQPSRRPPPWPRVIADTVRLSRERRRRRRPPTLEDERPALRLWIPVGLGVAVVVGVGFAVKALIQWDADAPSATTTLTETGTPSPAISSPATSPGTPGDATSPTDPRAAAGADIANRVDIDVSPQAAEALEQGAVDGRVLVLLSALANADQLVTVDVPSTPGSSNGLVNLEMGVLDVDAVLSWLESQPQLKPDRMEVRRESDVAYIRPGYDSPEPSGLFPS